MDDRFERLTAEMDGIRQQLNDHVGALLHTLARAADAAYPGKVVGATLFVGAADIEFVEDFQPDFEDPRWKGPLALATELEGIVRQGRRHGVESTMSVRLDGEEEPNSAFAP